MSDVDERLIVMLEARVSEFEKRMAQAERRGTKTYNGLSKGSKSATRAMEADMTRATVQINQSLASITSGVGKFAAAFGVGFVAGGAVAALEGTARAARETVRAIAEIGDEAKRAGVSAEAFQEWRYVAEQNRIGFDALTDGFKELNLRADEFISTGSGPAAEAFGRLGFNASDLADKLKDPSALMLEIIGRLEGMDKAAQIRIADEVFGGAGGERFVELIAKGEDGLRGQIDRARELGLVMDEQMIGKAAELDAKFNEVTARMQSLWRAGVVGAAEFFGLIEQERAAMAFTPEVAARVIGEELTNVLADLPEVGNDARAAIEGLVLEYEALGVEARSLVLGLNDAAMMMRGVGNEAAAADLTRLANDMGGAARAFEEGTISGEEFAAKLTDVIGQVDATITEMDELDRVRLGGILGQIQGLYDWIASLPGVVATARAEIKTLEGLDAGPGFEDTGRGSGLEPPSDLAPTSSTRPRRAPPMLHEAGTVPGGRSGGGGGGAGRVDALLSDLQTERELVEAWYAESLDLLNSATDAQLEVIGGRHGAIERLETEHQDRLRSIRDQGDTGALANAETFFGALATVTAAGGDRMVKVSRVFGAAEALINTYRAQSQVLADPRLGFWAKLPAVAAIGAAGMRMVSAIKGGGGSAVSAGGSASSAGQASSAAATGQEPMRVLIQPIDPRAVFSGQALIDLVDGLQKEFGNRGLVLGYAK